MAAIGKFEEVTSVFAGQGDLFMFDSLESDEAYGSAKLSTLTNPKSLGQIVQDSTSWDGDDPETTEIKDEQGNIITAKTTAGTLAFSFEIASTSLEMIKKFLKGKDISDTFTSSVFASGSKVVGFGTELPVFTAPIVIVNDEKTRSWVYPKAKITSNLSYADGLWRIKASVIAQYLNTANLMTVMIVDGKVGEQA